nr:PREDICTED: uncharacterized protein LOC106702351 [Latimeria chalumnae]|eukprot:XP_014339988.1 PREDICTED: uncharacterized protein LOC106702351 [Latimeria chalumnae]
MVNYLEQWATEWTAKHCKEGPYICTKTNDPKTAFTKACETRNSKEKKKKVKKANCVMAMIQVIQELSQRYDYTRDECCRLKETNDKRKEEVGSLKKTEEASAAERKLTADQLLEFRRENTQLRNDVSELQSSVQKTEDTLKKSQIAYKELWEHSGKNPDRRIVRELREAENKIKEEKKQKRFFQRRIAALGQFPIEEDFDSETEDDDSIRLPWGLPGAGDTIRLDTKSDNSDNSDQEDSKSHVHGSIGERVKMRRQKITGVRDQKLVAPITTRHIRIAGELDPQTNRTTYQYEDQPVQREMTV